MREFFKNFGFATAMWMTGASASAGAPPIVTSEVSEAEGLFLGKRVDVWENTGAFVKADAIVRGERADAFAQGVKDFPGPGYIKGEMWVRVVVRNNGNEAQAMALESRYPLTDFISFHHLEKNGLLQTIERGDRSIAPRESYAFRSPSFEFIAEPGDNTLYLRTESKGPNILSLYLWHADAFKGHRFIDTIVLGALFGFLIALFIYNSFLAISFWSRTYSYYSLFLLTMILLHTSMQNIWPYLVSRSNASWLSNEGYLWIGTATNSLALVVTTAFLYMKKNLPRFRRVFHALMLLSFVPLAMGVFVEFDAQARLLSVSIAVNSVAMIVASLMAMFQGYRPATYYLIASMTFMGANILLALNLLGSYHTSHVIQYGNFVGVVVEGLLMSLAIGDRVHFIRTKADEVIRKLNQELQNHLTQVEAQVAERTETIRTILDNVASGFVIVDPEGHIIEGFSQSCYQLLGTKLREGDHFSDLLHMPPATQRLWHLAWSQLFQDTMPTNVALAQLPSAIVLNGRALRLESKALRGELSGIKHVLFTIQDVTELRRKQRETRRNRTLIKILQDLEAFRQFINHSFEFVSRLKVTRDKREQVFLLHTLKGNSRVFGLKSVAHFLHQLEESRALTLEDIQAIERLFLDFLSAHDTILKTPWGSSVQEPRVTRQQLRNLEQLVERKHDPDLKKDVDSWVNDVLARPVSIVVQPVVDNCRRMAKKMQKPVRIDITGADARVRTRQEEKALEFLVHIIRNAIVHGIESDRETLGKSKEGHIQLEFKETPQSLRLSCRDDGQGFDRAHWEEKARALASRPEREISKLPWIDLVELVSRGGYTTQSKVTLDAGRGVGLEGIIHAVRALGSRIHLESEAGRGSCLVIELLRTSAEMLDQAAS